MKKAILLIAITCAISIASFSQSVQSNSRMQKGETNSIQKSSGTHHYGKKGSQAYHRRHSTNGGSLNANSTKAASNNSQNTSATDKGTGGSNGTTGSSNGTMSDNNDAGSITTDPNKGAATSGTNGKSGSGSTIKASGTGTGKSSGTK